MSEKISFRELVKSLSGRTGSSLAATERFVRELVHSIESGLRTDGEVSMSGVGKFELRRIKERSGTHPQTGEKITIPAHYRVVFKPYKALREEVNKPYAHLEARPVDQGRETAESPSLQAEDPASQEQKAPGMPPREGDTVEKPDKPDQNEQLWSGEVIIRERPGGKDPESSFFIQLDEKVSSGDEPERLILERPSPLTAKAAGSSLRAGNHNRRKTNERIYWSILSIVGFITLLIWILYYIQTSDPTPAGGDTSPDSPAETEIVTEPSSRTSSKPDMEETEIIRILVKEGETLWSIAGERLDNSYLWPWIYQLNKQSIEQPNLILAGSDLYLPVTTGQDLNKKERKSVATGYLGLYRWHKEQQNAHAHHFLWAAGSFCPNLLNNIEQQVDHTDLQFARNR
ncbi:MAG: HU family DNA-binding protein [Balneolaceae bacterium]